jgi:hypothetical protein
MKDRMELIKSKLIIHYCLLLIMLFSISCIGGRINRFEEGLILSNELYIDLSSQLNHSLKNNSEDTKRAEKLKLINQKLEEYRVDYDSLQRILTTWRDSGQKPENTMQAYKKMWYSLLDAQTLATQSFIYTSECSARTAIKGKAGKNCP